MKDLFKWFTVICRNSEETSEVEETPIDDDLFFEEKLPNHQADKRTRKGYHTESGYKTGTYKLKIKYNHKEMEIPEDEAIPLIQKGMNYDKLQERYNAIQNDPRLSRYQKIEQISKLLSYQSDEQLIDALYQNYYQLTAQRRNYSQQIPKGAWA